MPSKFRNKQYLENSYYHIFNRGVEKRPIFLDNQDYNVFLSYLQDYLLPKNTELLNEKLIDSMTSYKERANILKLLRLNNFADEITLLAFCLMPNHFHFFLKQKHNKTIDRFIKSIATRYTMYFNRKYKRVGSLYQDIYKASLVTTEEQFVYITAYIHKQALDSKDRSLQGWDTQPSSYLDYIGNGKTSWVYPEEVLSFFSKSRQSLSYESFVKKEEHFDTIQNIIVDE